MLLDNLLASKFLSNSDKTLLKSALVLKADNISDYLYRQNRQEEWGLTQDFPNVAPPFERVWIEYRLTQQVTIVQLAFSQPNAIMRCPPKS